MHYLSSRDGGGGSIPTIEITPSKPMTINTAYFALQSGTLVVNDDLAPVVMLPRINSSIGTALPVASSLKPYYHQDGASSAPGSATPGTTGGKHIRVPLTTEPYVMYLHMSSGTLSSLRVVVMNEATGARVSELSYSGVYTPSVEYLVRDEIAIAAVLTSSNKVSLLCNVTTDNGVNFVMKVVEFEFNTGTSAITATSKTNIGAAAISSKYTFIAAGAGVSNGKVAVNNGSNFWVVNLIANTMSLVTGLISNNCQVEDNKVVTLSGTNTVTVTDLETNGSSSFSATGSTWSVLDVVVRLWPRVYLIVQPLNVSANQLRILTLNSGLTAGVVSVLNCPQIQNFVTTNSVVCNLRSSTKDFYLFNDAASENFISLQFGVDSSGAVVNPAAVVNLQPALATAVRNMSPTRVGRLPYILDRPIVAEVSALQNTETTNPDSVAYIWIKYRMDVHMHLRKPKFIGVALASVVGGNPVKILASPQIKTVQEVLTPFTVFYRTMKLNATHGIFFDFNKITAGAVGVTDQNSLIGSPVPVDENGFNYPLVFGSSGLPVEGELTFTLPPITALKTEAFVVTPFGVTTMQSSTNAAMSVSVEVAGFAVIGSRVASNAAVAAVDMRLKYDLEVIDYV